MSKSSELTASDSDGLSLFQRTLGILFVATFGILLALGGVELFVRSLLMSSTKPRWSDRPAFYFKDPQARTLQDFAYPKEKPEGNYRIAVIGDSFTFATQMQFTDAYPKVLERMLNLNAESRAVEVINFGVPGYSTTHEVGAFKHVKKYQPDMLLLQITLNDPQLKPYTPTGITGENEFEKASALGHGGLSQYWKTYSFIQTRLHNTRTHYRYKNYYQSLFSDNSQTYRNFKESLRLLAKKSKKQDIKLVAVIFPLFGLPLNESYPFSNIHQKIAEDLTSFSIEHLDLLESYQGIPLARLQLIPQVDFHPNEIGHRIAGERLYDWLVDSKLIPENLKIAQKFRDRLNILPKKNTPLSE